MEVVSKDQIAKWKLLHGDIFQLDVEDKVCFLKKPDRKTLSAAMTLSKADPLKFNEVILENCWLGGDEEIKTNEDYFLAAGMKLDVLMEFKRAEIKKI